MKNVLVLLFFISSLVSFGQFNDDTQWNTIFDGNGLEEWEIPKNNVWWSIEEDVLWAKSDPEKIGSILWTKQKYTDFVVQLDFKYGDGIVDTGIFMRGEDSKNVQVQIGESGSLKRDMTASPYIPSLGYPKEAEGIKDLLKLNDWNTIKARAIGDTYTVWLNGEKVMTYQLENANLTGPIGIQLHPSKEMTVQFKNIIVAEL